MSYAEPPLEQGPGALTRVLTQLVRTWWITVPLAVIGLVAGLALAFAAPTTYTAEAQVGVGGQSLADQTAPQLVFAAQDLAVTYARYVDDASSTGRLAEDLGVEASETVDEVSAAALPDSSIIQVEVTGTDEAAVVDAAASVADALITQVNELPAAGGAEEALAEFQELGAQVSALDVRLEALNRTLATQQAALAAAPADPALAAEVDATRAEILAVQAERSALALQQTAAGERYRDLAEETEIELSLVREARVTDDDAVVRMATWGFLGAVGGIAVAWLLGLLGIRRRRRAATEADLRLAPRKQPGRPRSTVGQS